MKSNRNEHELVALYRGFFILGDQASLKVLFELERVGQRTFTQLKSELNISPTTLSRRLKLLCTVGLVAAQKNEGTIHVYYSIAKHHKQLKRFLDALERLSFDMQKPPTL